MRDLEKKVIFELKRLFYSDLFTVFAIWFSYILLIRKYTGPLMVDVLYLLSLLSFILLQGSIYWWILLKRRKQRNFAKPQTAWIYLFLKYFDFILLIAALPLMQKYHLPIGINRISIFLWLFILAEWINYFAFRLSYPGNPLELLQRMTSRRVKKSRLAKEIKRKKSSFKKKI